MIAVRGVRRTGSMRAISFGSQRSLAIEKATRVANYVNNITYEVGVIAHSCGVREPRELRRHHARVVTEAGLSIPLDEAYGPEPVHRMVNKQQLG